MKLWLVISSYRNDQQIVGLIEQVDPGHQTVFEKILIVDSEGTGRLPQVIEERGWKDVIYRNYDQNLGSGANLAHRLQIAADSGADYAYAMNHDSQFHPEVVSKLADACSADPSLGAAYPLSLFTSVGRYNLTGTRELPLSRKLVRNVNEQPLIDVFWSSSNGAIYSLDPIRKGILPWDAMWMGWEDLDYGWRLFDHGYRQVIVRDAVFKDNNEYTQTNLGSVTDKPPWRTYYLMRNLILAVRRSRNRPLYHAVTAYRAFLEASLILGIRKNKAERLRLLTRGIIDGIRGVTGQVPSL